MFKQLRWISLAVGFLFFGACTDSIGPSLDAVTPTPNDPRFLLIPTGMANPFADMRYYDGTYTGTPGTGSVGYLGGTLYRDNTDNGATSKCMGEGCGSHPGTDIPRSSGTNVYASYQGRVIRSECNWNNSRVFGQSTGWGGLIIIKSPNPYGGDSIYFSYAHLDARYVSVGNTVTTGQNIGKSGGDLASGVCPGASSGAHLHYQIDRSDSEQASLGCNRSSLPWFPTQIGRSVHAKDSDYYVTRCTYNAGSFIVGGYYWTFWQANAGGQFKEYWTANGNLSVTTGAANSEQALILDGGNDPWIGRLGGQITCEDFSASYPCSTSVTIEANLYTKIGIDMNRDQCYQNPVQIFFITNSSTIWNEDKSVKVYPQATQHFHVNMAVNQYWTGIITGIRIDPSAGCNPNTNDPIYIGYVSVERSDHATIN